MHVATGMHGLNEFMVKLSVKCQKCPVTAALKGFRFDQISKELLAIPRQRSKTPNGGVVGRFNRAILVKGKNAMLGLIKCSG